MITEHDARLAVRILFTAFLDVAHERLTSTERITILRNVQAQLEALASSWDISALGAAMYQEEIALIDEYLEGMVP